jgi:carbon monoxide dehydrogenase subunit G
MHGPGADCRQFLRRRCAENTFAKAVVRSQDARAMKLQGTHAIAAPPAGVFAALTDPAILQRAIPGCEKLEKTGEDEYNAHLKIGLAAIKGSYVGKVRLSDRQPPHRFTLHMDGRGAPGFVKGTTVVELQQDGPGTRLSYAAEAQVGGLIAAVGSRLIEAAARKLADEFFKKFAEIVQSET